MLLHLHGFSSVGTNAKYYVLVRAFPDQMVVSPTLTYNPSATKRFLDTIIRGYDEPIVVIGTSLGGFYAYWCAAMYNIPAVMLNPSFAPWETLQHKVGIVKRLETDDAFEWKAQYIEELKEVFQKAESHRPPEELLNFFLSTDDETLDHSDIPFLFPNARTMKYYDNSGHFFKKFQKIMPDVREILDEERSRFERRK